MSKPFASTADTVKPRLEAVRLSDNVYAFVSGIDPTNGLVVGKDCCVVVDTRATPRLARELIAAIREITDKPIRYVALTHYHAVRTMGFGAFDQGCEVIASAGTRELIMERGQEDFESEARRFPRLFEGVEEITGLTWPLITFPERMSLWLGNTEVQLISAGRAHTAGDTLVWLPREGVLWGGDVTDNHTIPYMGDSYPGSWPTVLDTVRAIRPKVLVPGRNGVVSEPREIGRVLDETRSYVETITDAAGAAVAAGEPLKAAAARIRAALTPSFGDWPLFEHCLPFNVVRAVDFVSGIQHPRIWTAERDAAMWNELQGD
ncbi:MBL fold metallo-hydrolase [Arenibaculum pallidiluteum]|uniref:MBL fold metallo-hydrolase n=1 Tax=Arenibaculum pallidiluteum TaxID=2812559 RepID=UPI001A965E59|nr:MBL fold metallo-hydrolase [Arenibaculum pallidiluteum]